jgi:hypothetical protein
LAIKERLETDNEIEQLAAWTSTGEEHFSAFTTASTKAARTTPILSKLSPIIYTLAAVELK